MKYLKKKPYPKLPDAGYAVYKLEKNGIDTNHALAEVQKRTGVRLKALGLKDSRAVTSQYVCATSKLMGKIQKMSKPQLQTIPQI